AGMSICGFAISSPPRGLPLGSEATAVAAMRNRENSIDVSTAPPEWLNPFQMVTVELKRKFPRLLQPAARIGGLAREKAEEQLLQLARDRAGLPGTDGAAVDRA